MWQSYRRRVAVSSSSTVAILVCPSGELVSEMDGIESVGARAGSAEGAVSSREVVL